jgi:hypothetical protein
MNRDEHRQKLSKLMFELREMGMAILMESCGGSIFVVMAILVAWHRFWNFAAHELCSHASLHAASMKQTLFSNDDAKYQDYMIHHCDANKYCLDTTCLAVIADLLQVPIEVFIPGTVKNKVYMPHNSIIPGVVMYLALVDGIYYPVVPMDAFGHHSRNAVPVSAVATSHVSQTDDSRRRQEEADRKYAESLAFEDKRLEQVRQANALLMQQEKEAARLQEEADLKLAKRLAEEF